MAEVCPLSPKNSRSRSGRNAAPEKRETEDTHPPRVRIPSESTNEGVEGMQIGGVELHLNDKKGSVKNGTKIRKFRMVWIAFCEGVLGRIAARRFD